MKSLLSFTLAPLLLSCMAAAEPEPTAGYGLQYLPSRILESANDVTTDEALLARQKSEKFGGLRPKDQEMPSYDLASYSTFIQIGDRYTLVPKGAVLNLPEKLASLVVKEPTGLFVHWQEFQAANRATLTNLEISLEQASGQTPIEPAKIDAARRAGVLLVAVIRGGAVSVASKS